MEQRKPGENIALGILAFVAVPAVGFLVGWLSGAGQNIGTAFVLGLLTVLLTLLGYKQAKAVANSFARESAVVDDAGRPVASTTPPKGVMEKAIDDLSSDWLSALLGSIAAWTLCLAWIYGVVEGKKPHRPSFPSVSAALAGTPVTSAALQTRLNRLRLVMRGKQLEPDDFTQFVVEVVVPLVQAKKETEAEAQIDWFIESLAKLDRASTSTAAAAVKSSRSADGGSRDDGGTAPQKSDE
jgi:hypothetical protein